MQMATRRVREESTHKFPTQPNPKRSTHARNPLFLSVFSFSHSFHCVRSIASLTFGLTHPFEFVLATAFCLTVICHTSNCSLAPHSVLRCPKRPTPPPLVLRIAPLLVSLRATALCALSLHRVSYCALVSANKLSASRRWRFVLPSHALQSSRTQYCSLSTSPFRRTRQTNLLGRKPPAPPVFSCSFSPIQTQPSCIQSPTLALPQECRATSSKFPKQKGHSSHLPTALRVMLQCPVFSLSRNLHAHRSVCRERNTATAGRRI